MRLEDFEFHPACLGFPDYSEAELSKFVATIKAHGFRPEFPIMRTTTHRIVDGRQRLHACIKAGVDPVFVSKNQEIDDSDENSIILYVIDANINRRNLSHASTRRCLKSTLAMMVVRTPEIMEPAKKAAKRRQKRKPDSVREPDDSVPEQTGRWAEAVSAKTNIDEKTLRQADALNREAPDLAGRVASGEISVKLATEQLSNRKSGRRKNILANAAFQRASEFVSRIEGCVMLCEKVNVDAIKSDRRILRDWKESIRNAMRAMRTLLQRLEE